MNTEITDLLKHTTWKVVDQSEADKANRKVTKSRWCYTIKLHRDGSIERFKARFVVCGYSQVKGEDYTHAFSATLRATSFRLLMAMAAGESYLLNISMSRMLLPSLRLMRISTPNLPRVCLRGLVRTVSLES